MMKVENQTASKTPATWDNDIIPEEALRMKAQAFSGNFENAAVAMAILDSAGKWLKVNRELCHILGYTKEAFYKLSIRDITHPDDCEADLNLLKEIFKGTRDNYRIEKRYFHKDGHILYVILAVSVIRDHNGDVLYFVSQIVDISEIRKNEQRINNLLTIASDQNEQLKNFAHIVSHNLRSHSSGIATLLKMIEEENPEFFENEMMTMLKLASDNLSETIANLNKIVEINDATRNKRVVLNLKAIIDKQINSASALAIKNGVKIFNHVPVEIYVNAVDVYMESICLNLITNAIKYRSEVRDSFLKITALTKPYFTIIEFTDNGLGINLDVHSKYLFGMYNTFHQNADSKGIGLFITKNQVEAMGGKIEVESEENKGSTFRIYLKSA